ncbi:ABC transporter ATP-binding protein [Lysinibacter cavernae]|uniref:Putative ABC transport system ATP-binding protein n=1 Tax=Lysinibacter cavernae TaxID=1640652 RepID=A0A7X5R0R3_9MICO|nr:ABC transporter ATP-binding protein [Lysinibacter cavernae]NIH53565.1 putative ABC transport system ATP-binding protein [Lysinibacter cavernae]
MKTPVITARLLNKSYGSTVALGGVSLAINRGEAIAIMGTSGSGKTTLLHCLAGLIVPDHGDVAFHDSVGGADPALINRMSDAQRSALRRDRFGFVFQQGLLLPELTAVENTALPLMVAGLPRRAAEERAAQWLQALGLAGMETRRIGQLSGGQAQRVAIARAQVTAPDIVFADEPTGALDSRTSEEVLTILRDTTLNRNGALVIVTHDEAVAQRCHRVLRLRDGVLEGALAA